MFNFNKKNQPQRPQKWVQFPDSFTNKFQFFLFVLSQFFSVFSSPAVVWINSLCFFSLMKLKFLECLSARSFVVVHFLHILTCTQSLCCHLNYSWSPRYIIGQNNGKQTLYSLSLPLALHLSVFSFRGSTFLMTLQAADRRKKFLSSHLFFFLFFFIIEILFFLSVRLHVNHLDSSEKEQFANVHSAGTDNYHDMKAHTAHFFLKNLSDRRSI